MIINIDDKKLYDAIKMAVSDVIKKEIAKLRLQMIPYVDDDEMEEIKEMFGNPKKHKNSNFK
jgi:hypothetical protein